MSPRPGATAIRVLVVEDSAVQRELLCSVLSAAPGLAVTGTARDGAEGVAQAAALRPDVIVMDCNMPRMNGYEATRRIVAEVPTPIVMTSASLAPNEVQLSFAALDAGALALVEKPPGVDDPGHAAAAARLVTTVKLMAAVTVVRRRLSPAPGSRPALPRRAGGKARVVAIAASTGGPPVIAEILTRLSEGLNAAVLIVQHMAPGFLPGFAGWLSHMTGLPVRLAQTGEAILPGRVYLAPDHCHMAVAEGERISLQPGDGKNGFCPSASVLLASVGERCGAAAVGIVLTGMGDDGADGLLRLRQAGGVTIAQDQETSVVFGMPKQAIALGAAEHVLPPAAIAALVRAMTG